MVPRPEPPWRVLIAEDDVAVARTLSQMLREDGYDVEVVLDGAAAISRLGRAPSPDVLIVDYRLPHADGLAVATYARSRNRAIHVVLVTSYAEVIAKQSRALDPPVVMLDKPLAYADLTRELERARGAGRTADASR